MGYQIQGDAELLLKGIIADKAWDRFPILADALEETGYPHTNILLHLRQPFKPAAHDGDWRYRQDAAKLRSPIMLPGIIRTGSYIGRWDTKPSLLVGHKVIRIREQDDDVLRIDFECGETATFYHDQDCCESVRIESIDGSLEELVGHVLTECREDIGDEYANPAFTPQEYDESHTWTCYTLATAYSSVTVRWYGESNGYYGESVNLSFSETPKC